ncbi:MAG: L-aspartate oxidase [Spirochaetes bacterium]|nr:L-aspartate oxidase [Spirochaetota bacterium]
MNVVIIGSGIAGLTTALELADKGIPVDLLTKESEPLEANSFYAQGGIVYCGPDDSPEQLISDINAANSNSGNPHAIAVVANEGPRAVKELLIDKYQVPFARTDDGSLIYTREAAHTKRRILSITDATGEGMMRTMYAAAHAHPNITMHYHTLAIDVIVKQHRVSGIYVKRGESDIMTFAAAFVVIATGGIGQIYAHTTNPRSATGDGYALAARAGCTLSHMEYTQFHPTTLCHPNAANFLLTEALRGEGAEIIAMDGTAFMKKYHPAGSLAPRDIVSRAIVQEMTERGDDHVLLDCTKIGAAEMKRHFPHIVDKTASIGIDIFTTPVPIVPAYHFSCGGVAADLHGRTNIEGLYAVGEVAYSGLHGVNRLASTSLLECVVFGRRIAEHIAASRLHTAQPALRTLRPWQEQGQESDVPPTLITQDWQTLKNIMWNYVGIVRQERHLARAMKDIAHLTETMHWFYAAKRRTRALIQLTNAITTASIVTESAYKNKISGGCHYRLN